MDITCTTPGGNDGPPTVGDACLDAARRCCQELFDEIIEEQGWQNPIVNEEDFIERWLDDCANDACMLTDNKVDCADGRGEEFQFAEANARDTGSITSYIDPVIIICEGSLCFFFFFAKMMYSLYYVNI